MSAFQTLAMPCVSRGIQTSSSHAPATAPKLRHSARSRGIHAPLSRHHRCCDYAQHDGVCRETVPPAPGTACVSPAVAAEPKLRHSARSRGIHAPLSRHHRCCDYAQHDGVCRATVPPAPGTACVSPAVAAEPKLRHSARSRGIHAPLSRHHGCCDYAQHDGVCRATVPPAPGTACVSPAVAAEPKLRHSARSRGIHAPLSRHHRCCDYAQHDGVCRATVPPAPGTACVIPAVAAEPKLRHSARSRGIHAPLSRHHGCCDYAQHDGAVMPCVSRGVWEPINNPDFKPVEFDRFKALVGLNRFLLSPLLPADHSVDANKMPSQPTP